MQGFVGKLTHWPGVLEFLLELIHGVFVSRVGAHLIQALAQPGQLVGQPTDRRGVGASIVVHHDDRFAILVGSDVIYRFPSHPTGQCAVANQSHRIALVLPVERIGTGNPVYPRQ